MVRRDARSPPNEAGNAKSLTCELFETKSVQQKWLQLVEMKQPGFSECNSALALNAGNIEVGEEPKPTGRRA